MSSLAETLIQPKIRQPIVQDGGDLSRRSAAVNRVVALDALRDVDMFRWQGLGRHLGRAGPVLIEFAAVLLVWLLLYHLYRQKIFLRI